MYIQFLKNQALNLLIYFLIKKKQLFARNCYNIHFILSILFEFPFSGEDQPSKEKIMKTIQLIELLEE